MPHPPKAGGARLRRSACIVPHRSPPPRAAAGALPGGPARGRAGGACAGGAGRVPGAAPRRVAPHARGLPPCHRRRRRFAFRALSRHASLIVLLNAVKSHLPQVLRGASGAGDALPRAPLQPRPLNHFTTAGDAASGANAAHKARAARRRRCRRPRCARGRGGGRVPAGACARAARVARRDAQGAGCPRAPSTLPCLRCSRDCRASDREASGFTSPLPALPFPLRRPLPYPHPPPIRPAAARER
jgi:hypothetical protein